MGFTLTNLLTFVGAVSLLLTLIVVFLLKRNRSWLMSYVQNFCGTLFLVSGAVKAVDPLGTAYKMKDYFTEFESTFQGTWFSFLAPLFPLLSSFAIWFSVTMIVFEIVLGIMLIIGSKPKLTAWLFFLLVLFFTVLTGFTFLTGYVPSGVNFFEFGKWGPYVESNMKVTDCGCFGDFIKLEPKTSFLKDVFLMFPAIYFMWKHKDMHQLFSPKLRTGLVGLTLLGTFIYCLSNFAWNLPKVDFRPFHNGADIRNERIAEMDAQAEVAILGWKLKNLASNEIIELPNDVYMKQYAKYPKTEWKVMDQIKSKPAIKATKISEFEITDVEGYDLTDELLENTKPYFMIVSYKMYGEAKRVKKMVKDSVFVYDTIMENDLPVVNKSFTGIQEKEQSSLEYIWDPSFSAAYKNVIKGFVADAQANGNEVIIVTGGAGKEMLEDFEAKHQIGAKYATADDILLKTFLRSNPGVMLWKDGKILDKWHYKKLPDFASVKSKHLN